MNQVQNLLEARKKYLLNLKKEKELAIKSAPEGTLRVHKRQNGKIEYFHRCEAKKNGIYLKEKDHHIAAALAQKDYDQKVTRSIDEEISAINIYKKNMPAFTPEQIYETLTLERQNLVNPFILPDHQLVEQWLNVPYTGLSFNDDTPVHYTAKGNRVRSKSEVLIADALDRCGIPFRYEFPIQLQDQRIVYPDFTVLNVRLRKVIYWEHFGRMDDPDYMEKTIRKLNSYEMSGIFPGDNLIFTCETLQNPVNQMIIKRVIEHYLL